MKVGAHVSTAGGLDKAIDRAAELGAEAIQIFISSPRGWAFKPIPQAMVSTFREKAANTGISAVIDINGRIIARGPNLDPDSKHARTDGALWAQFHLPTDRSTISVRPAT